MLPWKRGVDAGEVQDLHKAPRPAAPAEDQEKEDLADMAARGPRPAMQPQLPQRGALLPPAQGFVGAGMPPPQGAGAGPASVAVAQAKAEEAARARAAEQMALEDAWKALNPDFRTPFASVEDAVSRYDYSGYGASTGKKYVRRWKLELE